MEKVFACFTVNHLPFGQAFIFSFAFLGRFHIDDSLEFLQIHFQGFGLTKCAHAMSFEALCCNSGVELLHLTLELNILHPTL